MNDLETEESQITIICKHKSEDISIKLVTLLVRVEFFQVILPIGYKVT